MKEQLISFETAKLAKEKGFVDFSKSPENIPTHITQSLLQKWLRDKHNININIMSCMIPSNETKYFIFKGKLKWDWHELYNTYEEALENRLMEALKLIK